MMLLTQDDVDCGPGCPLCDPIAAARHVFRKRDRPKDKRGNERLRKRRRTPCDCWLCTPGATKRRMLLERARARNREQCVE
jgi:hypothetical protein